ncbi:MAG: exodeoxyribonuclease VII small subunit [Lachnospiraceae bacterium]|nr:exodeoxyribonuclease VII small subunit [Candidatus Minthocola equi]
MEEKELTLEESFDKLSELLSQMEEGEHTLEENFALYEEGLSLVKNCHEKLDKIEKKLIVLEEQDAD